MPVSDKKVHDKMAASSSMLALIVSRSILAGIKAFLRYFVTVGFVLFFLPRYVPTDAHIPLVLLVWGVYLLMPYVLWKFFDRFDAFVEGIFGRDRNKPVSRV